jgi:hypothetical protein
MAGMTSRWKKRALALPGCLLVAWAVWQLLTPAVAFSPVAAARNQYIAGHITLQEARRRVGEDVDASDWPAMKARWEARHKLPDN